ncbi:hypothetical protein HN937_30320 [Candidatus Poribacteria bacterium]|mgnify:CR=1 FL=1|jgi:hypothetical protein|nr:hypothetical protein [Candidatus Poribacteria bacterium]
MVDRPTKFRLMRLLCDAHAPLEDFLMSVVGRPGRQEQALYVDASSALRELEQTMSHVARFMEDD